MSPFQFLLFIYARNSKNPSSSAEASLISRVVKPLGVAVTAKNLINSSEILRADDGFARRSA